MGLVLEGIPAGMPLSSEDIQRDLDRRRPGRSPYASPRKEEDRCQILSGLTAEGLTNGAPIAIIAMNSGARGSDYRDIADKFRPGHADYGYFRKYGLTPQPGGGRSSGRETLSRVAAGAVARAMLRPFGITAESATVAVGLVEAGERDYLFAESHPLRFCDPKLAAEAEREVREAMNAGDSVGARVEVRALAPAGLGDPVFDKLEARLGLAYFSIGAVKAVEFGEGIAISSLRGSEANDAIGPDGPVANRHGGTLGGISSGRPILARLFIKPTPSIAIAQKSVDITGKAVEIKVGGRHDPCLAPRLGPVAEAMALLTLADFFLGSPGSWEELKAYKKKFDCNKI
jgi:chorismate synthase